LDKWQELVFVFCVMSFKGHHISYIYLNRGW